MKYKTRKVRKIVSWEECQDLCQQEGDCQYYRWKVNHLFSNLVKINSRGQHEDVAETVLPNQDPADEEREMGVWPEALWLSGLEPVFCKSPSSLHSAQSQKDKENCYLDELSEPLQG